MAQRRPRRPSSSNASSRAGSARGRNPARSEKVTGASARRPRASASPSGKAAAPEPESKRNMPTAPKGRAPVKERSSRRDTAASPERIVAPSSLSGGALRQRAGRGGVERGPGFGFMLLCQKLLGATRMITQPLGRFVWYVLAPSVAVACLLYALARIGADHVPAWKVALGELGLAKGLAASWLAAVCLTACAMPRIRIVAGWFLGGYLSALVLREGVFVLGALDFFPQAMDLEMFFCGAARAGSFAGEVYFLLLYVPLGFVLSLTLGFLFQSPLDPVFRRNVIESGKRAGTVVRCVGPYEIVRRLHQAARGPVFAARSTLDDTPRELVTFTYRGPGSRMARRRFEDAAQVLCQLEHPHLLTGLEYGEADGVPYLACRRVEGGRTLAECVGKGESLPLDKVLQIARDIADALEYLAARNTRYNALRLDTVLVDSDGRAYLRPEALVHRGSDAAAGRVVVGYPQEEPYYLSPEQVLDATARYAGPMLDWRSDQWALGALCYRLLSGEPPFREWSAARSMRSRLDGVMPSLADVGASVPDDVQAVLRRMLARSPAERYPTPEALLQDLDALLRGEPTREASLPTVEASSLSLPAKELSGEALALKRLRQSTRFSLMPAYVTVAICLCIGGAALGGILYYRSLPDEAELARRQVMAEKAQKYLQTLLAKTNHPGTRKLLEIEATLIAGETELVFEEAAKTAEAAAADPEIQNPIYQKYKDLFLLMARANRVDMSVASTASAHTRAVLDAHSQSKEETIAFLHRSLSSACFRAPQRAPIMTELARLFYELSFKQECALYAERAMEEALLADDNESYVRAGMVRMQYLSDASEFAASASLGRTIYAKAEAEKFKDLAGQVAFDTGLAYEGLGGHGADVIDWYTKAKTSANENARTQAVKKLKRLSPTGERAKWHKRASNPFYQYQRAKKAKTPEERIMAYQKLLEFWGDTPESGQGANHYRDAMQYSAYAWYEIGKAHQDQARILIGSNPSKAKDHLWKAKKAWQHAINDYYPQASRPASEAQLALAGELLRELEDDNGKRDETLKSLLLMYHTITVLYPLEQGACDIANYRIKKILKDAPGLQGYYEKQVKPKSKKELAPTPPKKKKGAASAKKKGKK